MDLKKLGKELLPYIIIVIVVILIRTFIVTPVRVDGPSMNQTLTDGNIMLLNKLDKINRYDIVVANSDERLIKRVIALPNETISAENGNIYIDGKKIDDQYGEGYTEDFEKVILGNNEYFIMGDNRENSKDSRYLGPINKKDIKGTSNFRLFPFNKFGNVKN